MDRKMRRELIIDFIDKNGVCTKEDVVNGLNDHISRRTVYDILKELMEEGIIQDDKEKENGRDHRLSVAKNNIFYSKSKQLLTFEPLYCYLFDKVVNIVEKKDQKTWNKFKKKYGHLPSDNDLQDLFFNTLVIFQMMMMTCLYESLIEWPKLVSDKGYLLKLQGDVFQRITELHSKLSDRLISIERKDLQKTVRKAWRDLYPENFLDRFNVPFEDFGLFEDWKKIDSTGLINYGLEDVELDKSLKKWMASGLEIAK